MADRNVLVVGCGGLGSETVKLLKMMRCGVTVLDYDIIEASNLNRQFYFQEEDSGRFKAEVIAEKTNSKYIAGKVEDTDPSFLGSFDIVFSCLDSISSRMQLNYLFFHSKCRMMVDCGVEGLKAHAKRVSRATSCLYCIKDLYSVEKAPLICSLKSPHQRVTAENRDQILNSIVFQKKERVCGETAYSHAVYDETYEEIVAEFNSHAPDNLKASVAEVKGIFENIIPNVCTINSICASIAVMLAFRDTGHDFVYFDGSSGISADTMHIDKDPSCFVCRLAH